MQCRDSLHKMILYACLTQLSTQQAHYGSERYHPNVIKGVAKKRPRPRKQILVSCLSIGPTSGVPPAQRTRCRAPLLALGVAVSWRLPC